MGEVGKWLKIWKPFCLVTAQSWEKKRGKKHVSKFQILLTFGSEGEAGKGTGRGEW